LLWELPSQISLHVIPIKSLILGVLGIFQGENSLSLSVHSSRWTMQILPCLH